MIFLTPDRRSFGGCFYAVPAGFDKETKGKIMAGKSLIEELPEIVKRGNMSYRQKINLVYSKEKSDNVARRIAKIIKIVI